MKKLLPLLLVAFFSFKSVSAQFGYGLTFIQEPYQRYTNPEDTIAYGSAGSFLFNLGIGPKIWVGGNKFSISGEVTANIGLFGLAINDYKGIGMTSFPFMVKFNFGGLSALDKEGKTGFSIGAGVQYNKTDLYYLRDKFEDQGVTRSFFKTYVIQTSYGFGMSGFAGQLFVRYGFDPDTIAKSINMGFQFDFNIPKLKGITNPESDL